MWELFLIESDDESFWTAGFYGGSSIENQRGKSPEEALRLLADQVEAKGGV